MKHQHESKPEPPEAPETDTKILAKWYKIWWVQILLKATVVSSGIAAIVYIFSASMTGVVKANKILSAPEEITDIRDTLKVHGEVLRDLTNSLGHYWQACKEGMAQEKSDHDAETASLNSITTTLAVETRAIQDAVKDFDDLKHSMPDLRHGGEKLHDSEIDSPADTGK
jgi:hypothetical protein